MRRIDESEIAAGLPRRARDAHKGSSGRVLDRRRRPGHAGRGAPGRHRGAARGRGPGDGGRRGREPRRGDRRASRAHLSTGLVDHESRRGDCARRAWSPSGRASAPASGRSGSGRRCCASARSPWRCVDADALNLLASEARATAVGLDHHAAPRRSRAPAGCRDGRGAGGPAGGGARAARALRRGERAQGRGHAGGQRRGRCSRAAHLRPRQSRHGHRRHGRRAHRCDRGTARADLRQRAGGARRRAGACARRRFRRATRPARPDRQRRRSRSCAAGSIRERRDLDHAQRRGNRGAGGAPAGHAASAAVAVPSWSSCAASSAPASRPLRAGRCARSASRGPIKSPSYTLLETYELPGVHVRCTWICTGSTIRTSSSTWDWPTITGPALCGSSNGRNGRPGGCRRSDLRFDFSIGDDGHRIERIETSKTTK